MTAARRMLLTRRSKPPKTEGKQSLEGQEAPEPHWEAAKARAEFQREIYRVRDGRIASADTQATILAGAAAATATLSAGAMREASSKAWLIAVVTLAGFTVLVALFARREVPIPRLLKKPLQAAKKAVAEIHELSTAGGVSTIKVYEDCFKAWLALTTSAESRERQKRWFYVAAVLFLLGELLIAAIGIFWS